jgi:surface antigen
MQKSAMILSILLGVVVLAQGCATREGTGRAPGAAVGTAVGAAVGDTESAIIGGLVGTLAGGAVGRQLDRRERQRIGRALENDPSGQSSSWTDPDTGEQYSVIPRAAYGEEPCRDFIFEEGTSTEQYTACRQNDGTWRVQS